jgi:tetratricopeptide (TPR) repeat protein
MERGDWRAAATFFRLASGREPDNIEWRQHRATAHLAAGEYGAAIKQYRRALELGDLTPVPHAGIGDAFRAQVRPLTALTAGAYQIQVAPLERALRKVINRLRGRPWVLDPRCARFEETRAYNEALFQAAHDAYEKAIRRDPTFAHAWAGNARLCATMRRLPEALRSMTEAVALAPRKGHYQGELGLLLEAFHRHDEAQSRFQVALRLDPAGPWQRHLDRLQAAGRRPLRAAGVARPDAFL